jgi:AraC-like DNA-binding protein
LPEGFGPARRVVRALSLHRVPAFFWHPGDPVCPAIADEPGDLPAADKNRRIGEIADAVGYSDLYTFSKMFKRHLGISPKKFRELDLLGEKSGSIPRKRADKPRHGWAGGRYHWV